MANMRLTKNGITIKEMIKMSSKNYKKKSVDNKEKRKKMDIVNAKFTYRRGMSYNFQTKQWEQESRDVRLDFIVKSDPISYKKTDNIKYHKYPVTFLIKTWEDGINSTFRYRSGGIHKWKKPKKKISEGKTPQEKDKIRQQNQKIQELNIKRGIDGSFIFTGQMFLAQKHGILFGPMTAENRPPSQTNPQNLLYFDKHSLFIAMDVLPRLFTNPKLNQIFKNPH